MDTFCQGSGIKIKSGIGEKEYQNIRLSEYQRRRVWCIGESEEREKKAIGTGYWERQRREERDGVTEIRAS